MEGSGAFISIHQRQLGWGTNEELIISILAHRNAHQRKLIRDAYQAAYGEDMLRALEKELTRDFERAVLQWQREPAERDAYLANEATKKITSSNLFLVEIACTRTSDDLFMVSSKGPFGSCFMMRKFQSALNTVTMGARKILATRSKAQLSATLNHYNNEFGNAINKDLKADPKDDYLSLLRATIKCLTIPEKYFEKLLRHAINKMGTDEWALTRVVTTRAEVDMQRIVEEYYRRNSVPLDKAIAKDTHGDYEKMLLAVLGHEDA
ncbi:hypothetical protein Ancab_003397 [Ancistrocladus abbreviatus]